MDYEITTIFLEGRNAQVHKPVLLSLAQGEEEDPLSRETLERVDVPSDFPLALVSVVLLHRLCGLTFLRRTFFSVTRRLTHGL